MYICTLNANKRRIKCALRTHTFLRADPISRTSQHEGLAISNWVKRHLSFATFCIRRLGKRGDSGSRPLFLATRRAAHLDHQAFRFSRSSSPSSSPSIFSLSLSYFWYVRTTRSLECSEGRCSYELQLNETPGGINEAVSSRACASEHFFRFFKSICQEIARSDRWIIFSLPRCLVKADWIFLFASALAPGQLGFICFCDWIKWNYYSNCTLL